MDQQPSTRFSSHGALSALLLLAGACGSPAPAPVAPPPPPPAAAPSAPAPAAAPTASAAPAPEPAPAPPPAAEEPVKRSQKPINMLTARDAAFQLDYANSEVKQRASDACNREVKDPAKVGACLEKARDAFQADVIRFKRDPDDKKEWEKDVQLLIYKRSGSALREVSVGKVSVAEDGEDGVRVTLGKQKGVRPLWRGQTTVVIKAPNEYSIEINDPDFGRLRYDAKIGLLTD